jgi:hypothetical protein
MYFDTAYNSTTGVFKNIYSAYLESATKMWIYTCCLPTRKQPGTKLLIKTIIDLKEMAYVLLKSKGNNKKNEGYQCHVKKAQIEYLCLTAFRTFLVKRQSKYGKLISWLDEGIAQLSTHKCRGYYSEISLLALKTSS